MIDTQTPQTVLCIPGPWADRSSLVRAIAEAHTGYLFAGSILTNTNTKHACKLEFTGKDARMLRAFQASGFLGASPEDMKNIASHQSVVYLLGAGGSRERTEPMMLAGAALVRAGGFGVKVESAGIAHNASDWLTFCDQGYLFSAHRAFVIYGTGDETYSCGMHNLGLRDAIVAEEDASNPVDLLQTFTHYLFHESPLIKDGQTFSVARGAPGYRLRDDPGIAYEEGSFFSNPYGAWRLVPL